MKCPACDVRLKVAEKQGVEIDYCPECRGVWLDRGELDKLIERSTSQGFSEERGERDFERRERDSERREPDRKKRRSGFLGELFNFE